MCNCFQKKYVNITSVINVFEKNCVTLHTIMNINNIIWNLQQDR